MIKNAIGAALVVTRVRHELRRRGNAGCRATNGFADRGQDRRRADTRRMTGPGTMGPRGYKRLCTPRSIGLYEWQVRWVERLVRPTETQRAALNDLQAASAKAIATISAACKTEAPATTSARTADDRQPTRRSISGREDLATGVRRVLRLVG